MCPSNVLESSAPLQCQRAQATKNLNQLNMNFAHTFYSIKNHSKDVQLSKSDSGSDSEKIVQPKFFLGQELAIAKNLQGETGQNPTKSKRVPGCLPGQVTGQSKAHPCLVFSTNVSDHSLLYSENVSGTVSVSHILGECLWRCLYTLKMSLALRPIFGQCWPALAVVCSLFSDNGGQLQLLSK